MAMDNGKEIIYSGWRAARILDALKLGLEKLPSIDPFGDIALMLNDDNLSDEVMLLALCDVTVEEYVTMSGPADDYESDDGSEWEEDFERESDNENCI